MYYQSAAIFVFRNSQKWADQAESPRDAPYCWKSGCYSRSHSRSFELTPLGSRAFI